MNKKWRKGLIKYEKCEYPVPIDIMFILLKTHINKVLDEKDGMRLKEWQQRESLK